MSHTPNLQSFRDTTQSLFLFPFLQTPEDVNWELPQCRVVWLWNKDHAVSQWTKFFLYWDNPKAYCAYYPVSVAKKAGDT